MMVLNDNGTFVYQRGKELKITRNSVSFESNVYQLCNITGFSSGRVERRPAFSYWWIIVGFIVGAIFVDIDMPMSYFGIPRSIMPYGTKVIGLGVIILSILCVFININQESRYGLILSLNSGDKHLFVTNDMENMSKVVSQLYDFIESKKDGVYLLTINDNSIKIEGNMTGVAASGTGDSSTISSNVSRSGDKE